MMHAFEETKMFSWDTCEAIWNAYTAHEQTKERTAVADSFLKELQRIDAAHSIRIRTKDSLSLIRKVISKQSTDILKYGNINAENYYKIITDLIGARLIIRYKHQWLDTHNKLIELFDKNRIRYIEEDYVTAYIDDKTKKRRSFVEAPVAYIKKGDDDSLYMKDGKHLLHVEETKRGYRSIHYVIKYKNQYIEVQVRTIFEEAWSECDHDFVYKEQEGLRKIMQQNISGILSNIAHQGDELSSFMYNVAQGKFLSLPKDATRKNTGIC
jgi:ppGpp synthetase/RelA/SpoT-type nucleotidyltranferase